jgi:hypothetical protein
MIANGGNSVSNTIQIRAAATGVGNAANVIDVSIYIKIRDVSVPP